MLLRAGLSPMEALIAATQVAASILDLEHELGTVEAGKCADLDPCSTAIRSPIRIALDRVTHVVHKGALVKSPTP